MVFIRRCKVISAIGAGTGTRGAMVVKKPKRKKSHSKNQKIAIALRAMIAAEKRAIKAGVPFPALTFRSTETLRV